MKNMKKIILRVLMVICTAVSFLVVNKRNQFKN